MTDEDRLSRIARARIAASLPEIRRSLQLARAGIPLAAEPEKQRRVDRLQSKRNIPPGKAEEYNAQIERGAAVMEHMAEALIEGPPPPPPEGAERVWGDTVDFVPVAFLERGAQVARSVGRVAMRDFRAVGSGVLVGEGLFLTNHHVIPTPDAAAAYVLELDYEHDLDGQPRPVTRFAFDPTLFVTDDVDGLDFTLVGVGAHLAGPGRLDDFGVTGLSAARDKHMIGEFANIIQHPRGRFKEAVLRENRLVSRYHDALHYVADTEPGSSGSPVYNSEWRCIALHHWGGPHIDGRDADLAGRMLNEGIRISSIVRALRDRMAGLPPAVSARIAAMLEAGARRGGESAGEAAPEKPRQHMEVSPDGRVTWTLPIEVSVRLPIDVAPPQQPQPPAPPPAAIAAPAAPDPYRERDGYDPAFLAGFPIPLPGLGPDIAPDAARLLDPEPGARSDELKYRHFSIVMNARRRLAFFTACNIDGATSKLVNRRGGSVTPLAPDDPSLIESLDDAEGDSWRLDPRIPADAQSGLSIYRRQRVPGFPRPQSQGRILRMFQKGHLVRRIDPAWGNVADALEAERDSFHWTNAAPQVGFFNMGKGGDLPGTEGGRLWRAAENHVLRNAVADDMRVTSFTGPIFREDDRAYRDIQIPGAFFKLSCWTDQGRPQALALLVDQSKVFREWPEASLGEAFLDPAELARVDDFLSTVAELERLTGLDFGAAIRAADVRAGCARQRADGWPLGGGDADDLTRIAGIGPAFARRLKAEGVTRFSQIAGWDDADIEAMDAALSTRGRIRPEDWVGQARGLAAKT